MTVFGHDCIFTAALPCNTNEHQECERSATQPQRETPCASREQSATHEFNLKNNSRVVKLLSIDVSASEAARGSKLLLIAPTEAPGRPEFRLCSDRTQWPG